MDTALASRLFRRSLDEKLADFRKSAFVPMGTVAEKTGQQAMGPGGMPVDPAMGGGAPMDPMAGGAPPMDPMAGGMPPMDPMAGGMPPMDPMAGGEPPLPPPEGDIPPPPPPLEEEGGNQGLTSEDAETVDKITSRTMDIVRQTLEMVGKAKPKAEAEGEAAAAAAPPPPPPTGPITGQSYDPAQVMDGPLKLASALKRSLASRQKA